jgi:hypothetical protein
MGNLVRMASLQEIMVCIGLRPILGGALEVPTQAETIFLKNMLNITAPQTMVLKLYTNNKTPAEGDDESLYTEMAGQGYASVTLTPGSWTVSGSSPVLAAYPQVTFSFTAGGPTNVYGYFVVQTTSGKLMWAERFSSAPFVIQNTGDQILITPQITLD